MASRCFWPGPRCGWGAGRLTRRSFGYGRFEGISGLINALTLFGSVGWILFAAVQRFQEPAPVLAGPMFIIAFPGMLVTPFSLWYLTRGETGHVNVKGAVVHVLGAFLARSAPLVRRW